MNTKILSGIFSIMMSLGGIGIIWSAVGWEAMVGVFFFMWGNNLMVKGG